MIKGGPSEYIQVMTINQGPDVLLGQLGIFAKPKPGSVIVPTGTIIGLYRGKYYVGNPYDETISSPISNEDKKSERPGCRYCVDLHSLTPAININRDKPEQPAAWRYLLCNGAEYIIDGRKHATVSALVNDIRGDRYYK